LWRKTLCTGANLLVLEGLDFGRNLRNAWALDGSRCPLLVLQRLHQLDELKELKVTRSELLLEFCLLKTASHIWSVSQRSHLSDSLVGPLFLAGQGGL
jgi:hypothetical protein